MPTPQEIISSATTKARREWLEFTVTQEKKLYRTLNDAASQIEARINRYAKQGKLPPERLVTLLGSERNPHPDSIRGIMRGLRPKLSGQIKDGMRQSVNFGMKTQIEGLKGVRPIETLMVGSSFYGKDGKIRLYDVKKTTWPKSRWGKINTQAMDALMRTQFAGDTISKRVWDITHDAERMVRNRINTGVMLGDSVPSIARDCKAYLREPFKRFRRVKKDGKLVLSGPAKKFHPGRGIYRSSYQNAVRVARTELARAYNEGTVRYGIHKSWIKGWISRVGSNNPAPYDVSVNGKFFPKEAPPNIPYHPNCMCYPETVLDDTPDSELIPAQNRSDFEKGKAAPSIGKAGGAKRPRTV